MLLANPEIPISLNGKYSNIFYFIHSKSKTPVLGNTIPVLGVKLKRGCYVFWLFSKIALCSVISFKRYRRELSIDVAELGSMLKNYQNTHYPRLVLYPKQGTAFPETGVLCVYLVCEMNGTCPLFSS